MSSQQTAWQRLVQALGGQRSADKFTLNGHHVDVSYTIGANPSIPALTYQDETISKDFLPNAIHTDPTDLGNLVTVALEVTIDSGGTTFSVFLPTFDVPRGQSVEFKTIGIYKEVRWPGHPPGAAKGNVANHPECTVLRRR